MDKSHDEHKELAILTSAVENTNEAFVTIDANHKVVFMNRAAEKTFGYSRDEVVGHDLDVIMSPECSRDHRQAVERYVKTRVPGRIGHQTEIVATRKGGKKFSANISFSVSEVDGAVYFTAIIRDLTETKELHERMIRSERLAALGKLVAEITHEINNPLMLIGGFAHQLMRQVKDDKSREKLRIITNEVSRLEDLLKELREFYVPRCLEPEEIDVNALLQEVHSLVRADCEKRAICTDLRADKEPVVIEGDRSKLKQVFLNVVKNAIEAMQNGGNLSVRSERSGDQVKITIADNGCGIPKDVLEKTSSAFFTTKKDGTGLGLSISKSIIEDHKGSSLSISSDPGKGTTVTITMPTVGAGTRDSDRDQERRDG